MVTSREGLHHSLLTAIIILSLILDIGGGSVFIVYASMNLRKATTFPVATWLLVHVFASFHFRCVEFSMLFSLSPSSFYVSLCLD